MKSDIYGHSLANSYRKGFRDYDESGDQSFSASKGVT